MPRLTGPQPEFRARVGLTLVELLITLTLLGVIGTILAQMMTDQQRFYHQTNETMGLRRELRSAMSLMPADLRSVSSVGGDIISFSTTQITFQATLGAGIICAKPNATTIDLPPLNMARTTLVNWHTTPAVGDTLYAFRTDSMGAGGDSWTTHRITSITPSADYCPGSPFTDATLDAEKSRWRFTVTPAVADSVKIGAAVRFGRSTQYSLVTGTSGKYFLGRAEYVGGAWTAATPIAGPFTAPNSAGTGGLRFVMYDSTGGAVSPSGNLRGISRIDLTLRGQGASSSGSVGGKTTAKDSITFRIALRNRQ